MIPRDKILHFIGGAIIGLSALLIGGWAFLLVAVVAIGKEVWDYFHPLTHTAEIGDALATIAGGGLVVTTVMLVLRLTKVIPLALVVALAIGIAGCGDPVARAQADLEAEHIRIEVQKTKDQLSVEHEAAMATARKEHAKDLLGLTAHEQVALRAQSLSAKLEGALWVLGISLALNIAGGFFLASIMPSLSVTLFKMAGVCAVLIGLDVAADFLMPYVVEYIGWAALSIPVIVAGAVAYEVKTHPALWDWLVDWHPAGPPDSKAVGAVAVAETIEGAAKAAEAHALDEASAFVKRTEEKASALGAQPPPGGAP